MDNKGLINQLEKFYRFRTIVDFTPSKIINDEGKIICNGFLLKDDKNNIRFYEVGKLIDIEYQCNDTRSSILSNLYPTEFVFKGKTVQSIEAVLQAIKYKEINKQNKVLATSGILVSSLKKYNQVEKDKNLRTLYWQGKEILRNSENYQVFLDELFISALQNETYKKTLLSTNGKTLVNISGIDDENATTLTRKEFEIRINCLRKFVIMQNYQKYLEK